MTKSGQSEPIVLPFRGREALVADKLAEGQELSLSDILSIYQTASRRWRKGLSQAEWMVMTYIIDRTIGWRKTSFTAFVSNIIGGNEDYDGVGVSKATYFRVLESLEAKGFLSRSQAGTRVTITINIAWKERPMLPVPKRLKASNGLNRSHSETGFAGEESQTGLSVRLNLSQPETQNKDSRKKDTFNASASAFAPSKELTFPSPVKEKGGRFLRVDQESDLGNEPAEARPSAEDAARPRLDRLQEVSRGQAAHRATLVRKVAKPKAGDVEAVWKAALIESQRHGVCVRWSQREVGSMRQALGKWEYSREGTMSDVVHYAILNWSTICARRFAWMTKDPAPDQPTIRFFLWRLSDFVEAFVTKQAKGFATDSTNSDYERMLAAGKTPEEAALELASREAVARTREEMAKREEETSLRNRIAADREARAERMETFAEKITPDEEGRRIATLPDGQKVEVIPGTERRPGQVWGHQPVIKKLDEVPAAALKPLGHLPPLPAGVPTFEEAQAARAERMRQQIEGASAEAKAKTVPVVAVPLVPMTWEEVTIYSEPVARSY